MMGRWLSTSVVMFQQHFRLDQLDNCVNVDQPFKRKKCPVLEALYVLHLNFVLFVTLRICFGLCLWYYEL